MFLANKENNQNLYWKISSKLIVTRPESENWIRRAYFGIKIKEMRLRLCGFIYEHVKILGREGEKKQKKCGQRIKQVHMYILAWFFVHIS